jgi:hypothetical protein
MASDIGRSFLDRIASLASTANDCCPFDPLQQALQPALDEESELRKLWAVDRTNARTSDPYVHLVDIFDAPGVIRTTCARVVRDEEDLSAKFVNSLVGDQRRKSGTPCMAASIEEFQKNWTIFTEGSLSQLIDWNNVVAAGGSVLACLSPLPEKAKESKRTMRTYFHSTVYPSSDVDLFMWGLTQEQVNMLAIWNQTLTPNEHPFRLRPRLPRYMKQFVIRSLGI